MCLHNSAAPASTSSPQGCKILAACSRGKTLTPATKDPSVDPLPRSDINLVNPIEAYCQVKIEDRGFPVFY